MPPARVPAQGRLISLWATRSVAGRVPDRPFDIPGHIPGHVPGKTYQVAPPVSSKPTICTAITFTMVIDGKIIA